MSRAYCGYDVAVIRTVLRESGSQAKLIAVSGFHQHRARPVNADLLLRELFAV
jgi:hypothetical protein